MDSASTSTKEADVLKQQLHARVYNEKKHVQHGSQLKYNDEKISREQERLRKQLDRLTNEKRYYQETSYLKKDRRLSLPEEHLNSRSRDEMISKSTNIMPDTKNVKSRLFDYEKNQPRGLREIKELDGKTSPSTPRAPMATHALQAHKTSHTEIVRNVTRLPHGLNALRPGRQLGWRRSDENPEVEPNKQESQQDKPGTSHDKPESPSTSKQDMKSSNLALVSVRDKSSTSPLGSQSSNPDVTPTYTRLRRGSLPARHFGEHQQPRRLSITENAPIGGARARRMSLPAGGTAMPLIPAIRVGNEDDDTAKLNALYNRAIQTVEMADENLLMDDHPANYVRQRRRHSDGGAVFDKSTLYSTGFNLATLRELESILSDARVYSDRKNVKKDELSRLDAGSRRAQKKRIEHLEEVLKRVNPHYNFPEINPEEMLKCSYLRLSQSNVETLEDMMRAQGKDPGIHIHSDVTNLDIWKNLKEERTDHLQSDAKVEKSIGSLPKFKKSPRS